MARQVAFVGKRLFWRGQAESWRTQIHEVGGILAVEDGEGGIEADVWACRRSRRAPMAWKVPDQVRAAGGPPWRAARRADALDPPRHLGGGAAA